MNVGSFRDSTDVDNQLTKLKQTLQLQIKNAKREAEGFRSSFTSSGEVKPPVVASTQYRSIEDEQADKTLQLQNALKSLNMIFKYPLDAKNTLDMIVENYNPVEFNKYLPEFLRELGSVEGITPSKFVNQWERFITILRSRGDNLIKIGVNDDKAKILLIQEEKAVEKFITANIPDDYSTIEKNRIIGSLRRAAENGDEKDFQLISQGKEMISDAKQEKISEDEIQSRLYKKIEEWKDSVEEKMAEMEVPRGRIRVSPNVEARLLGEVQDELRQEANKNLVAKFLEANKETFKLPSREVIESVKERLQEGFKKRKERKEQVSEIEKTKNQLTLEFRKFFEEKEAEDYKKLEEKAQEDYENAYRNYLETILTRNKIPYNEETLDFDLKKLTNQQLLPLYKDMYLEFEKKEAQKTTRVKAEKYMNEKWKLIKDQIAQDKDLQNVYNDVYKKGDEEIKSDFYFNNVKDLFKKHLKELPEPPKKELISEWSRSSSRSGSRRGSQELSPIERRGSYEFETKEEPLISKTPAIERSISFGDPSSSAFSVPSSKARIPIPKTPELSDVSFSSGLFSSPQGEGLKKSKKSKKSKTKKIKIISV